MTDIMQVEVKFFHHLLACLANQKYIHEHLPEKRREFQEAIDKAWNEGMEMLSRKQGDRSDEVD